VQRATARNPPLRRRFGSFGYRISGVPYRHCEGEDHMLFMSYLSWTDQGIRSVKDAPKRTQAARELAKKFGIEIKQVYLTSGDSDLLVILDAPDGDAVAKFAMTIGGMGNARTRTVRAWSEAEFLKLVADLP
jgi:uncharacterized protein with GYD domain